MSAAGPADFRAQALESIREDAVREHGTDAARFLATVAQRLALGDDLYGNRYLSAGWDGRLEAAEELEDAVAYVVLTLERAQLAGGLDGRLVADLSQAAAHICAAHAHVAGGGPE